MAQCSLFYPWLIFSDVYISERIELVHSKLAATEEGHEITDWQRTL